MDVETHYVLQGLYRRGWVIDIYDDMAFAMIAYRFFNKSIFISVCRESDDGEDQFLVEASFVSKYSINARSQRLFESYTARIEHICVGYQERNTLIMQARLDVLQPSGEPLTSELLDEQAVTLAEHLFEFATCYEMCARQVAVDTKRPEHYRRVLPRRQLEMILLDNQTIN